MKKILTTGQAGKRLNLSTERVRQLADAGKIPCLRAENNQRLFYENEVLRFLRDREDHQKSVAK